MNSIGFYPPRGIDGVLVDNLSELPTTAKIEDFNEFFRLYVDHEKVRYIYRVKNPISPLSKLLSKIND